MKYKENRDFLKVGLQFDMADKTAVHPLAESDQIVLMHHKKVWYARKLN
ncbi:MAG: hypothetical protein FWF81_02730 [Defluviitaleaceae bacterium]|nr:hypothetical protein [Defluviitaleaceae bacterium]